MNRFSDQQLICVPSVGSCLMMMRSLAALQVYFEIQEDWLEQWGKQQIRDSKNNFLFQRHAGPGLWPFIVSVSM